VASGRASKAVSAWKRATQNRDKEQNEMTRTTHRAPSLAALAAAAVFFLAGTALAYGPPGGCAPGAGAGFAAMLEHRLDRLDLDPSIRNEIDAILAEARPTAAALRDQVAAEHERMRALIAEEAPDQAAIDEEVDRIGSATGELRKHEIHTMLAVRALLTPEQRDQLRPQRGRQGLRDGHGRRGHRH